MTHVKKTTEKSKVCHVRVCCDQGCYVLSRLKRWMLNEQANRSLWIVQAYVNAVSPTESDRLPAYNMDIAF